MSPRPDADYPFVFFRLVRGFSLSLGLPPMMTFYLSLFPDFLSSIFYWPFSRK